MFELSNREIVDLAVNLQPNRTEPQPSTTRMARAMRTSKAAVHLALKEHFQQHVPTFTGQKDQVRRVLGSNPLIKTHSMGMGSAHTPYLTEAEAIRYADSTIIYNPNTTEVMDVLGKKKNLVLADISRLATSQIDPFLQNLSPEFLRDPEILAALASRFRLGDGTHKTYFGIVRRMCEFFKQNGFSDKSTVRDILADIDQTVAFPNFLYVTSRKRIAASSIGRFEHALYHALRFFSIPITIDKKYAKSQVEMCKKLWGLAPKPTAAIPKRVLRHLFVFLKQTDTRMFKFFTFAFFTASRVGEMLKLKRSDFFFSPKSADRPWIKIRLRNTKTRNKCSNDGLWLTFYKLKPLVADPTQEILDPYELSLYWYQNSGTSLDNYIVPFSGSLSQRSRQLYRWFRNMKWDFKQWVLREKKLDVDVTKWRYHSMRTTFVGIMRGLGMSWEDIQLRTGHKFDSQVTRDTYFMNALMSNEFDNKFEQILDTNLDARNLFLLHGGLDEQAPQIEQDAFRDDEKHRDLYENPLLDNQILPDFQAEPISRKKCSNPIPKGLSRRETADCILKTLGKSKTFLQLLPGVPTPKRQRKRRKPKKPRISARLSRKQQSESILREFGNSPAFLDLLPPTLLEKPKKPLVMPKLSYSKKKKAEEAKLPRTREKTHSSSLLRANSALQLHGMATRAPAQLKSLPKSKNIWLTRKDEPYVPTSLSLGALSSNSFSMPPPGSLVRKRTPVRERDGFPWCPIRRSHSRPPTEKN